MKEVKPSRKPLIFYYFVVLLVVLLFNMLEIGRASCRERV